jgi:hypothetical protein
LGKGSDTNKANIEHLRKMAPKTSMNKIIDELDTWKEAPGYKSSRFMDDENESNTNKDFRSTFDHNNNKQKLKNQKLNLLMNISRKASENLIIQDIGSQNENVSLPWKNNSKVRKTLLGTITEGIAFSHELSKKT